MTPEGLPDKEEDRRFFRLIEEREPSVGGWIVLTLACGHIEHYRVLPEAWTYAPCYTCLAAWEEAHQTERGVLRQWQEARKAAYKCEST